MSVELSIVKPNCSWQEEMVRLNPTGCFLWKYSEGTPDAETKECEAPTRRSCKSFMCGVMFEVHRGGDPFIDFDEAAAIDADLRGRAARADRACEWPSEFTRASACWVHASVGGSKELVALEVCRFIKCRAERGYPIDACVSFACA